MTSSMVTNPTLLITGASGFVGTHLRTMCINNGIKHFSLSRAHQPNSNEVGITDLVGRGIDVTIHLAGRAHVISENSADPARAFYEANVRYTQEVAKAVVEADIKRFIFISTVGVYGLNHTAEAIDERFPENPRELYSITKLEAEKWLADYLTARDVDLVVLRPSLIYGEGFPGNLARLYKLSSLKIPLPFKSATSPRTMLCVESFCSAMLLCSVDSRAAGHTFNVADDVGVSTSQLVKCFRANSGHGDFSFTVPVWLLKLTFTIFGRKKMYQQLFKSFYLDNKKIKDLLGWEPVKSPVAKLQEIALKRLN